MESTKSPPEPASPCWKKNAPDAGFLANAKDHFDQFMSTSMDQHRICLKKTVRGVGDYLKLGKQGKQALTPSKAATGTDSAAENAELD